MTKRLFASLFGGVAVAATLVGCGGGNGDNRSESTYGTPAGTWRATGITAGTLPLDASDSCPIVVTGELVTPDTPRTPVSFNCGARDTFTFNTDGTFAVTTEARRSGNSSTATGAFNTLLASKVNLPQNPSVTYTGRWLQGGARVVLVFDSGAPVSFPYKTELTFQNPDQLNAPATGFPSGYGYVLKRQ